MLSLDCRLYVYLQTAPKSPPPFSSLGYAFGLYKLANSYFDGWRSYYLQALTP